MSDEKRDQALAREAIEDLHRQVRKLMWGEKSEPEPWFAPTTRSVLEGAVSTIKLLRAQVADLERKNEELAKQYVDARAIEGSVDYKLTEARCALKKIGELVEETL